MRAAVNMKLLMSTLQLPEMLAHIQLLQKSGLDTMQTPFTADRVKALLDALCESDTVTMDEEGSKRLSDVLIHYVHLYGQTEPKASGDQVHVSYESVTKTLNDILFFDALHCRTGVSDHAVHDLAGYEYLSQKIKFFYYISSMKFALHHTAGVSMLTAFEFGEEMARLAVGNKLRTTGVLQHANMLEGIIDFIVQQLDLEMDGVFGRVWCGLLKHENAMMFHVHFPKWRLAGHGAHEDDGSWMQSSWRHMHPTKTLGRSSFYRDCQSHRMVARWWSLLTPEKKFRAVFAAFDRILLSQQRQEMSFGTFCEVYNMLVVATGSFHMNRAHKHLEHISALCKAKREKEYVMHAVENMTKMISADMRCLLGRHSTVYCSEVSVAVMQYIICGVALPR